ncbi:MAG: RND transporter [Phenylobacterium zucineum]|nr:MAG: RND transporter [Phenylobacterium zucineum]
MRRAALLACAAALALSACAGLADKPPAAAAVAPPGAWRAAHVAGAPVARDWWAAFGDPQLTALVEAALARNTDVAVAAARVQEAEAQARTARAALFPTLDAAAAGQYARQLNALGRITEGASGQPQLQAAWEVDLWGRLRALDTAGRAGLQASQAAREATALSVSAATARAYVGLLSLDAQLEVTRRTLAARAEALRVARRRADTGYTSQLERSQAEAEYQATARSVPALELAVRQQENALRVLTGDVPGAVARGDGGIAALAVPTVPAGLPSDLLSRRPDIGQAEAQLAASDARLAAARTAYLPQVRLTGALGRALVEGLDPVTVWSAGGSILAPIFDTGRRAAETDAAEARRDQAALAYRGVVLNAFAEVENALEGTDRLAAQADSVTGQRAALAEALRHATNRYQAGYASYLDQLDAQRGLLAAELAAVQIRESQLRNAVGLYQALGGGWSATPAP